MASLLAGILRAEDGLQLTRIEDNTIIQAVDTALATYTAERNQALAVWVDGETTKAQERVLFEYIELGQELGIDGRPLEARGSGSAEVAFMWRRIGWQTGWNLEDYARLTVQDLTRKVNAITAGNARTHTISILRAVFGNTNYQWKDRDGTVTIRRLANGDGQLYPLQDGTEVDANHYLVTGYTAAQFSASNNPFERPAGLLRRVFGNGQPVVAFVNSANRKQIQTLLPNMVDPPKQGISVGFGEQAATPLAQAVPGEFAGIDGDTGVYVYVWDRIPADYQMTTQIGAPAPLRRRIPAEDILQGFKVEAEETHNPFYGRIWRERFGYAAANRVSMVISQYKAGVDADYEVPAVYR